MKVNANESRRYGVRAPAWVRAEVRKIAGSNGVAVAARTLGISVNALTRTIAGLQQAPGTIDRIVAALSPLSATTQHGSDPISA